MKKNLTKEEYEEWLENYSKNKDLYGFYDSNDKLLFKEWLDKNRKQASDTVKESNGKISYYKKVHAYIVENKDGTYNIYEDNAHVNMINDTIEDKESLYDKVTWKVYRILGKIHQVITFIKDTIYYFKTYKQKVIHDRNIWYCLNSHILEDLKLNLPKLRDESHGYPGYINSAEEWRDKIDEMLLLLQSYYIYKDIYGRSTKECPQEWAKLGQKFIDNYKKLIENVPYYENSHDIDYKQFDVLFNKVWDDMWEWMKKYGGDLWD